ncbi:MAG TPA: 6-carboxytetrahydropterin synthase [Nocardioidaceae bacterium]|nr:6-carboxytetrahydropterin synthase [Nocardioidaceae bacterium]
MYTVTVRDHVMVAHSLPRPAFGPAQALHGATYVVEASFRRRDLDDDGIVIDIGAARSALQETLDGLRYRNLDEHPAFEGVVTSTEVLARWVADRLAESPVTDGLDGLEVVLRESPDAWVSYTPDR